MKNIDKRFTGLVLGLALVLGIVAGSAISADAQYNRGGGRNWDGYPNWGGSFKLRQTALNAGFNEGSKEGAQDRAQGRLSNFKDFCEYQKATRDYSSRLGNRELYRRYFQRAFESGYDTEFPFAVIPGPVRGQDRRGRGRNWDQYGNYGGSFELRQTALNAGYNDGNKQALRDGNRWRTDYRRNSDYQKATRDYSSKLGNRGIYRRYYREGYENGYQDGLLGYEN